MSILERVSNLKEHENNLKVKIKLSENEKCKSQMTNEKIDALLDVLRYNFQKEIHP
jgi:hypothetical protein